MAVHAAGEPREFDYGRSGNPTRHALEGCLAALEGGTRGFAFATGMAAELTALMQFDAGDIVLVQRDLYGGTYRLISNVLAGKGIRAEFVDLRDLDGLRSRRNWVSTWSSIPRPSTLTVTPMLSAGPS